MSEVRIIVITADWENDYEDTPHWKPSGDSEHLVAVVSIEEAAKGRDYIYDAYVAPNRDAIEIHNQFCESTVVDWVFMFEGELTDFERGQLEYEGVLDYPARPVEGVFDGPWCPIWAKSVCKAPEFPQISDYEAACGLT